MFAKFKRRKELVRLYEWKKECEPGTKEFEQAEREIKECLSNIKLEDECDGIPWKKAFMLALSSIMSGLLMSVFENYKELNFIPKSLQAFLEQKIRRDSEIKMDENVQNITIVNKK